MVGSRSEEEESESAVGRGELRGDGDEVEGGLRAKGGRAGGVSGEEDLETGDLGVEEEEEEEEDAVLEDVVLLPGWWWRRWWRSFVGSSAAAPFGFASG